MTDTKVVLEPAHLERFAQKTHYHVRVKPVSPMSPVYLHARFNGSLRDASVRAQLEMYIKELARLHDDAENIYKKY